MLERYARIVVAARYIVVPLWIAAAIAAWVALPGLGGAGASLEDLVPEDSDAARAQQLALDRFGTTVGADTLVVQRDPDGLGRDALAAHVRAVREAPSLGIPLAVPVPNAEMPGLGWPESGTAVLSFLFLDPSLGLDERRAAAQRYARDLDGAGTGRGVAAGVTGAGPARLAQFEAIKDALPLVEAATVVVIALIVGLYFRSLAAPVITLLVAAIAYVVAVRGIGWSAERIGTPAPQEVEPVVVVLVLGLVTDYTVFYMSELRTRLGRGLSVLGAARRATARITPIVFTAGLVVASACASLLAGDMELFRIFGPGLALCALVVTAVSVTCVPAILAIAGGTLAPGSTRPTGAPGPARRLSGLLATRPVAAAVVLVGLGGLVVAASPARSADPEVGLISSLPESAPERRAAADVAAAFGPGILAPVDVIVERAGIGDESEALALVQAAIEEHDGVSAVIGPQSTGRTPFRDLVVSDDGDAARFIVLLAHDPTGAEGIETVDDLSAGVPGLLAGTGVDGARVAIAGETALAAETVDRTLGDLARVAVVALVVIAVLLAAFLRAPLAAVLLVLASALGLAAAYGLSILLVGAVLGGEHFVYYVPLIAGVLLIGLGSDYNVFIAGRVRQEVGRRRIREAIAVGAASASGAITVAGITLAATFSLLAIVPLRPFRELAILMVVGILLDVLVVRRVLVPALLAVPGRVAWGRRRR